MLLIQNLILFCPAAYSKDALKVLFDERFTTILKEPGSWQSSPSFDALTNYTGKLLHIIGSNDDVIPEAITNRYKECSAINKTIKQSQIFHTIHDAPHTLHLWLKLEENFGGKGEVLRLIEEFHST